MGIHSEAALNQKFIGFAKQLNLYLNHFPRFEKYALSNRIRATAYELYDLVTEAQKRYYKKTTLTNLDIVHEKLRMQLHLANDLGYFDFKAGKRESITDGKHRYVTISAMVDELGKMIGAWIRTIKEENRWK